MSNDTWTLYNINGELLQLLKEREEFDDETFKDTWESLALERAEKIDNTLSFIKDCKAKSEALKEEAKKLKERADSLSNQAENTLNRLSSLLTPREKFENARHKLLWRESVSTDVTVEASELPEAYQNWKVSPDKTAIKEALQSGKTIPGCSLNKKLNLSVK